MNECSIFISLHFAAIIVKAIDKYPHQSEMHRNIAFAQNALLSAASENELPFNTGINWGEES